MTSKSDLEKLVKEIESKEKYLNLLSLSHLTFTNQCFYGVD